MHEIRAVTLSGYLEVAAAVGLDGYLMLRRAGIAPAMLADPNNRLPAAVVVRLLEQSAKRSGHDNFGLLMAENRSFASLGPISLLLDRLPNVRAVIAALGLFRRHMNDIVTVDLEETDGTALIKIGFMPEYAQLQVTDFAVAVGYRVLSGVSHGNWVPATVHLARQAPADMAPWWRFFQAPIEFDSLFNGFSCSSAALDIANPHADAMMAEHAERLLLLVPLPREEAPVSDRVRRAIALMLPNGQARLEAVAAQLGVNARALQRSLENDGTTFASLLRDVRRELAQAHLTGAQSVTTIAEQLGYASPSAFTRWFAGEFGASPQAWRNERRAEAQTPSPYWTV
ncbi:MAG: AraC family transcriptional regulator [Novosphingobium sp.]|nr:AraC family transcriptional regulator [Novosphingobium sp.]